jgi:hypothetical protein
VFGTSFGFCACSSLLKYTIHVSIEYSKTRFILREKKFTTYCTIFGPESADRKNFGWTSARGDTFCCTCCFFEILFIVFLKRRGFRNPYPDSMLRNQSHKEPHRFDSVGAATRCGSGSSFDSKVLHEKFNKRTIMYEIFLSFLKRMNRVVFIH